VCASGSSLPIGAAGWHYADELGLLQHRGFGLWGGLAIASHELRCNPPPGHAAATRAGWFMNVD